MLCDFKELKQRIKSIFVNILTCKASKTWLFLKDLRNYKKISTETVLIRDIYPCLRDEDSKSQTGRGSYFYQDVWALDKIKNIAPALHVDVGSRIDGFVGQCSVFVPVTFIDIRPVVINLPNITYKQGSVIQLPYKSNELESVSSLCVVEHIGLGRYGDAIDPNGTKEAIKELQRVVRSKGTILVSVLLATENKVAFNAHRLFEPQSFTKLFKDCDLLEYSISLPDRLIYNGNFADYLDNKDVFGLFHFQKK